MKNKYYILKGVKVEIRYNIIAVHTTYLLFRTKLIDLKTLFANLEPSIFGDSSIKCLVTSFQVFKAAS